MSAQSENKFRQNCAAKRQLISVALTSLALLLFVPISHAASYEFKPGQSEIVIQVYRGGAFESLGHNHIISTQNISGTMEWEKTDAQGTRFEITVPVDSFRVDLPELRRQAGKDFSGEVDDDAREGTRRNMLGKKVLNSKRFPRITARNKSIVQLDTVRFNVTIQLQLHGISRTVTVPVVIQRRGVSFLVEGEFSLKQSDYGVKPLSAAFGAIVVKDKVDIRFRLVGSATESQVL